MEAFLLSFIAPVAAYFSNTETIKGSIIFCTIMTIITFSFLFYRCKLATENKPDVNIINAIFAVLIWIIYIIILSVSRIISNTIPNPLTGIYTVIASSSVVFFLVSLLVYYNYISLSQSQCFEESLITKIKNVYNSIVDKIKCITDPASCLVNKVL
jgi:FtsH-binding integral membrane protein